MGERRRHKRYTLDVMEVSGKMILASDVRILDVSVSGISLRADRRLNIGAEYSLKLEDRKNSIALRGLVVWSSLTGAGKGPAGNVVPFYTAGLKLTGMSADKVQALTTFIEQNKREEQPSAAGRRGDVRFRIEAPEKAILHFPENYDVKKISLSGMEIECGHKMEVEGRVPMELFFPGSEPVRVIGRVASCLAKGEPELYSIGIEFGDLTQKDREALSRFIDHCALRKAG